MVKGRGAIVGNRCMKINTGQSTKYEYERGGSRAILDAERAKDRARHLAQNLYLVGLL